MFHSLTDLNIATQAKLYFIQPEPILKYLVDSKVSLAARSVYFFHFNLAYRKGRDHTQIYNSTISRALGISERCVSSAHSALESIGLIQRRRMPRPKGCFKEPAAQTELLCPAPLSELIRASQTRSTALEFEQEGATEPEQEDPHHSSIDEDKGGGVYRGKARMKGGRESAKNVVQRDTLYRGKPSKDDGRENAGEVDQRDTLYRGKATPAKGVSSDVAGSPSPELYRGKVDDNSEGAEATKATGAISVVAPKEEVEEAGSTVSVAGDENLALSQALDSVLAEDSTLQCLIDLGQKGALYGRLQSLLPQFDTCRLMAKLGFSLSPKPNDKTAKGLSKNVSAVINDVASSGNNQELDVDVRLFEKVQVDGNLPDHEAIRVTHQVSYAIEHGSLRDHDRQHAINICRKLIRERRWKEPIGYQFFLCYGYAPKPHEELAHPQEQEQQAAG